MKYFVAERLSEKISETPEGFLICLEVPITRTGVFEYLAAEVPTVKAGEDGKIRVHRLEQDVFSDVALASFEGKPVTIEHPEDWVNSENWKELAVGVVQNVRKGENNNVGKVLADLLITDATAISLVKGGLRELSCGYEAEFVELAPGEGKQVDITGNHVALVRKGRAGAGCKIVDNKKELTMKEKLKKLLTKAVDEAVEVETTEETTDADLGKLITDLCARIDALEGKKTESADTSATKEPESTTSAVEESDPITSRLDNIEAQLAKLLEMEAAEDESAEKIEDEEDNANIVGDADTVSRAEILAPGIANDKDIKVNALKAAYATEAGKKVIDSLTGGKQPVFDSAQNVEILFTAASEIIKTQRGTGLSKTKAFDSKASISVFDSGEMSPEKMNEVNAQFWSKK